MSTESGPGTVRRTTGSQRQRHSSAFKVQVALEAVKGQKTLNELATEFGVHSVQIAQWKWQLVEASSSDCEGGRSRKERTQEALIEQLYQQIGPLKAELDWLRKGGSVAGREAKELGG